MIKGRVRKIINVSGTLMVQRIANEATSITNDKNKSCLLYTSQFKPSHIHLHADVLAWLLRFCAKPVFLPVFRRFQLPICR